MKILHVIPYMHPAGGGPPVVVDRVCHELNELEVQADILTTNLYANGQDQSWKEVWQSADRIQTQPVAQQSSYAKSPALLNALRQNINEYDLVNLHTLWTHSSRVVRAVCQSAQVPYVVMPHGMLDPNSMQRKRLKKQIYGRLIEFPMIRASAGLLCTHEEEARLASESVSSLPTAYITPLGADSPPDKRETLRHEFYQSHPELQVKPTVVFLSRLHEKKGLDLLIPAIKVLRQSIPEVRLLLVGSGDSSYEQFLKDLIVQEEIGDSVMMTGNLSGREKWQAMAAGDVFALSSYQENFALVVVDALALGVPVVLSNRVNIWSNIVEAKAGLECRLEPMHIAEQLQSLLLSPEKCRTMGDNGQQLVKQEFTWQRCAERTKAAYQSILKADHS